MFEDEGKIKFYCRLAIDHIGSVGNQFDVENFAAVSYTVTHKHAIARIPGL
jgi:hypothetical protein